MRYLNKKPALLAVITVSLLLAPSGMAQAAPEVSSFSTTSEEDGMVSTLTIEFDEPVPRAEAAREIGKLSPDREGTVRIQAAPDLFKLKCGTPYGVSDKNGNMTAQHKCGGKTVPWGYQINSDLQRHITSDVTETGMMHSVNRGKIKKASRHKVDKRYHFHGTWYARDNDKIAFDDSLRFRTGSKNVTLKVQGHIQFTS